MKAIEKIANKFDSIIKKTDNRIQIWVGANRYAEFMIGNGKTFAELVIFKGHWDQDVTDLNGISEQEFANKLNSFLQ